MQKCATKYPQIESKNTRRITSHDQVGFTPGTQDDSTSKKQLIQSSPQQAGKEESYDLTNTEKALHTIQHPFVSQTFSKQGTDKNFLNLTKNVYKTLQPMSCSAVRKLTLCLKDQNKKKVLFSTVREIPANVIR